LLIFRRQLGIGFWIGTLVAMLGAGLVLGIETSDEVVGAILGLIAGVFYGGYFLVTQRGRELLNSLTYFWVASASSAVVLLLLAVGFRMPLTGYPASSYLNFLAMGVITQVFGYLAVSYALGRFPASIVAPTLLGQPVITALLAVPLLGEMLAPGQILGGVAVLAGVLIVHRGQSN
jgi:drug/metabolite transporter (DMT)-like permease